MGRRLSWGWIAGCLGVVGLAAGSVSPSRAAAFPRGRPRGERQSQGAQYSGWTSQHQPITFALAAGALRDLRFYIVLSCPSRHRYRVQAYGFAPIAVRGGRFARTFPSRHPPATATIRGRVSVRRVSGSVRLGRYVPGEHASCQGQASFSLHPGAQ